MLTPSLALKAKRLPGAFMHEGKTTDVSKIVTRWYSETHCYFRLQADDGHRYVLRLDLDRLVWELVMCENDRRVGHRSATSKRPAEAGLSFGPDERGAD